MILFFIIKLSVWVCLALSDQIFNETVEIMNPIFLKLYARKSFSMHFFYGMRNNKMFGSSRVYVSRLLLSIYVHSIVFECRSNQRVETDIEPLLIYIGHRFVLYIFLTINIITSFISFVTILFEASHLLFFHSRFMITFYL